MAKICIPREFSDEAKAIFKKGLSTAAREAELTKFFGKDGAKEVNKLYEASLLLKNQELAEKRFFDQFTEVGINKKKELLEKARLERQRKKEMIFNPDGTVKDDFRAIAGQTEDELIEQATEIYNKKYNIDISEDDIVRVTQLQEEAKKLNELMQGTTDDSAERIAYGMKQGEVFDIIEGIKNPKNSMGLIDTAKASFKEAGQRFDKDAGVLTNAGNAAKLAFDVTTSAVFKSIVASMDASFALRQGFKVMMTNPNAWGRSMVEALKPFKTILSKEETQRVAQLFRARMISRARYQEAIDSGLAIGVAEDFFPTAVAEKIPALGNIFKSSNEAFTIFSQSARMDMFEMMYNNAVKNGSEITPELLKDLASVANSISGRGSLGKAEAISGAINKLFFSGRFIRSQVDTFTLPFTAKTPEGRAQAMKTSVATLGTIGSIMAMVSMMGGKVETDWRSSRFGKARLPNSDTWVDVTAGLGSYISLLGRNITGESKNTKGRISKLSTGEFGSRTRFDTLVDFFTGKFAPAPSALVQVAKGRDFSGEKPTIPSVAEQLIVPIQVQNMVNGLQNEELATALIASGFDFIGAGTKTY